jgi:hypothetical protein
VPKPIRRTGAGARVCVLHLRSCAWAGGELVESGQECRGATPADRDKGIGVFAMPAPPLGADEGLVRLVAEADGVDPDEAVAEQRRRLDEAGHQRLAEWRRRDAQPWVAWLAEEQAKTPPSAQESKRLVERLVAEITATAQGGAGQHPTEKETR